MSNTTNTRALPDPIAEPTITVERAGEIIGVSRWAAYKAAERGELPVVRVGKRLVVPTRPLLRMIGAEL